MNNPFNNIKTTFANDEELHNYAMERFGSTDLTALNNVQSSLMEQGKYAEANVLSTAFCIRVLVRKDPKDLFWVKHQAV